MLISEPRPVRHWRGPVDGAISRADTGEGIRPGVPPPGLRPEGPRRRRKFFSPGGLIGAVLVSLTAAALLVLAATPANSPFFLEFRLASSTPGRAQLFYDGGVGLSETDSVHVSIVSSAVPLLYRLPLPPGTYRALRFDPNDRDGTVTLAGPLRVIAPGGRVARLLTYPELQPTGEVLSWHVHDGQLEVVTIPGGVDPQLSIDLVPPLELRRTWGDLRKGFILLVGGMFLALAGLGWAIDRVPTGAGRAVWRRCRHFAAQPPLWLTLAACAAVLAARRPDAFSAPQFWAEDSVIFYDAAYLRGVAAILEPYAGYLHAIPRLAAAAAMAFDPRWAPTLFMAVAFVGTLYVAARTQSARCPLPRHAGCALAVVLVPDAYEVLLNVTNLQWIVAGALVLLLVSADATRWWQVLHDTLAAVILGLTGPFSILLGGLFVLRAWTRRSRSSIVLAAVIVACASIQAWTIWRNPVAPTVDPIASETLLAVPGMRVTASLLVGWLVPADYPRAVANTLGVVALLGLAALGLRRGPHRAERIWMALAATALLAGSLYRCRFVLGALCHATFGSRYFYPISMIVLWLLLAATTDSRRWLARTVTVLVGWVLLVNLPRLREPAFPDLHWSYFAQQISAGLAVDVPVNPQPWVMSLPATKSITLTGLRESNQVTPHIIRLSTRVLVRSGGQVAVSGLHIGGAQPKKFLIRAVGPSLAQFGVTSPLSLPTLTVVNGTGAAFATNAGWDKTSEENLAALRSATSAAGAFALPVTSRDAALVVTVPPGRYTALVAGANNTTGVAFVEFYEVP